MLRLDDVAFDYGTRRVVGAVSLALGAAEIVCIVGPNGAGKSTLLRLGAGLIAPAAGGVTLDGANPHRLPRGALARRLAFLPQDYQIAFPFTVAEVVLMGRYPHRSGWALATEADTTLADQAMRRCDIIHLAERRFDALSGGERRRALLAQAFCQAAAFILLDEPTASLDPAHALAVFRILVEEKVARAAAALVVTHDLNLAARFADRLVLLDQGRLVADGPPATVLAAAVTARAFGVALHVGALTDGTPFVVPDRELAPPPDR